MPDPACTYSVSGKKRIPSFWPTRLSQNLANFKTGTLQSYQVLHQYPACALWVSGTPGIATIWCILEQACFRPFSGPGILRTNQNPEPACPSILIIFHNYCYMRHSHYSAVSVSGNPNRKLRTRHVHNQYPANKEFRVSGPPGILSIYKTSKQASFSRIKLCTWHVYSQCPAHLVSGTFQNGHVPVPDPDPAFSGPIKILKTHQPTFIYFS